MSFGVGGCRAVGVKAFYGSVPGVPWYYSEGGVGALRYYSEGVPGVLPYYHECVSCVH